jgi:hypothetical protein
MYTPQINLKIEQEGQLAHTVHKSYLTINTPAVSTYTSQVIPQNHKKKPQQNTSFMVTASA